MARKGLAVGQGKGYKNIQGQDPKIHSQSAKGIKQPQQLNIIVPTPPIPKNPNVLETQPTKENPYVVDDYPYGFRLRTKIRYWVETTSRGQRFVSQTLNPKTNQWNKPKESTYSQIVIVVKDPVTNHINHVTFSASYSDSKEADTFFEKYGSSMTDYQLKEFKGIKGLLKVYDKVQYTVRTRKYKNRVTGEITEQVNLRDMSDYYEVNEKGEPVDAEKERQEQKNMNIAINKLAVKSAMGEGLQPKEAFNVYDRATKGRK